MLTTLPLPVQVFKVCDEQVDSSLSSWSMLAAKGEVPQALSQALRSIFLGGLLSFLHLTVMDVYLPTPPS